MYDLLIIGAGPAGMTAAVYAARKKIRTLLLSENVGGQVLWTFGIENYMGYQFIEGSELMEKFEDQVRRSPSDVDWKIGVKVQQVRRVEGGFEVQTEKGESYQGKTLLVSTGKRPRQLQVPGEEELVGRGVSYCATCDGPLFTGERVAVIGGGNSALGAAEEMAKIAEHVYVVSLTELTGDQVLIDKVTGAHNVTVLTRHEVTDVIGQGRVEEIGIRDVGSKEEKRLEVAGVLVEIGLTPNSEVVKDLASLNELGEVEVSCSNETDTPGLFAAGDVTNVPEKQIVIAAGEGAKATLRAHRYLQRLRS
ncbi:MAG: FAD-dependent oxidoreductase [Chloroflexota bacterium]